MADFGSIGLLERPEAPEIEDQVLATAELAECNCPDFCERDHDTD
jgi:hypothetical protein